MRCRWVPYLGEEDVGKLSGEAGDDRRTRTHRHARTAYRRVCRGGPVSAVSPGLTRTYSCAPAPQIVLYLISRISVAIVKAMAARGIAPFSWYNETQVSRWCVGGGGRSRTHLKPSRAVPGRAASDCHRLSMLALQTFPLLATIVWGVILYLFEQEGPSVHKSLKSSMDFLYHDANSWAAPAGA